MQSEIGRGSLEVLASAVLKQAASDIQPCKRKKINPERESAIEFVKSPAFDNWCYALGVEPDYIRRGMVDLANSDRKLVSSRMEVRAIREA